MGEINPKKKQKNNCNHRQLVKVSDDALKCPIKFWSAAIDRRRRDFVTEKLQIHCAHCDTCDHGMKLFITFYKSYLLRVGIACCVVSQSSLNESLFIG
jgi:hypothetical protein